MCFGCTVCCGQKLRQLFQYAVNPVGDRCCPFPFFLPRSSRSLLALFFIFSITSAALATSTCSAASRRYLVSLRLTLVTILFISSLISVVDSFSSEAGFFNWGPCKISSTVLNSSSIHEASSSLENTKRKKFSLAS